MIGAVRSLYARVVLRIAFVLAFGGTALIVGAWFYARLAADEAYDRLLAGGALQIAENTWLKNGALNVDVPVSAFFVLSEGDRVFYKVLDWNGRVVAGDAALKVDIPFDQLRRGAVLTSSRYQGQTVRVALLGREMFDTESRGWATIVLAETESKRNALAVDLTLKALVIVFAMGVITVAGAMLAVRQALVPMTRLEAAIRTRDPNSLAPLDVEAPTEAEALVSAINDFIKRLDARIAMMKRVIGDVAHQIQTPITAALSQVELLEMQRDDLGRRNHIERIKNRLDGLGALVQQLVNHAMVLHRAEAGAFERVDIAALVRAEMTMLLTEESPRPIEISFDAPAEALARGDAVLLREAIRNVIGNALRYGALTRLSIHVTQDVGQVRIDVVDDGPGIPPDRWRLVRNPFNPRDGGRSGVSLGLAIVHEVFAAHKGSVQFAYLERGEFCVSLSLPSE